MKKTDTRKLKMEALQQLRHQAIRLRKKGMTYKAISEVIDVHYSTICGWWKAYEKEGVKGIRLKTRGRKQGEKRTLNPEQEKELQKIILLGNLSGGIQMLTILKLLKISQHIQTLLNTKEIKHGFKLGKEFTVYISKQVLNLICLFIGCTD